MSLVLSWSILSLKFAVSRNPLARRHSSAMDTLPASSRDVVIGWSAWAQMPVRCACKVFTNLASPMIFAAVAMPQQLSRRLNISAGVELNCHSCCNCSFNV